MTKEEEYQKIWQESVSCKSGCYQGVISLLIFALLVLYTFCSCRTKYIPIETIREVYISRTDTFIQHDTTNTVINTVIREARPEDSAMIADLGIKLNNNERVLILLQKQLKEKSKETHEVKHDTVIKTDSVPVPVPVVEEVVKYPKSYWYLLGFTILFIIFAIIKLIRWLR